MYVYIHDRVWQQADEKQRQRLELLTDQIQQGDRLLFGLLFSPRYPYWVKRLRISWRLLAKVMTIEDEQILCITHLLDRGRREYAEFLKNREAWGDRHMHLDEDQLQTWLVQRRASQPQPPQPRLPDGFYQWTEQPRLLQREDKVVFESRIWVEKWANDASGVSTHQESFYRIVCHLLELQTNDCEVKATPYANVQTCRDVATNCTVLYSLIHPLDAPHRTILFLLAPFITTPGQEKQNNIGVVGKELQLFGTSVDDPLLERPVATDEIARLCLRSYPDYLLCEEQEWYRIELEDEINFSLSGEEERLLHTMNFPAFINGRAGSGKSTMLHFAFAYYCNLYLEAAQPAEGDIFRPLFLTYSDRLSQRACEVVKHILISHCHYLKQQLTPEHLEKLTSCFQPFQKFLLNLLPPESVQRFQADRYISFNRFKRMYAHSFPKADYPAETAWHVIRTYIKGFDFVEENQDFLSREDYQHELPQAHKNIPDGVFCKIHENIWQKWYQQEQQRHGYWDDQDLALEVLKTSLHQRNPDRVEKYAAIFCDEAQDFTRIELQIILRLSIWSNYRLHPPLHSLPFAFAGDPMQTLNPTGFSWESFRASFYERILEPLDPERILGLCDSQRNFLHDLQQNYRSTPMITRFSNTTHLWRQVLSARSDPRTEVNISPQLPWHLPKNTDVSLQKGIFSGRSPNLAIRELKDMMNAGILFLIPCEEGGEVDFLRACVKRNPALEEVFPGMMAPQAERPKNMVTSAWVKGEEFDPPVVLFGFGDYFAQEFQHMPLARLKPREHDLRLEFFLNKLYVAVSRPKTILGIIDTEAGDVALWQAAQPQMMESWLDRLSSKEMPIWEPLIVPLGNQFNTVVFKDSRPLEVAQNFVRSALGEPNAGLFESAAFYYRLADRPAEAKFCQAWLLRLEGKLLEAGQQFMQLPAFQESLLQPQREAWRCFWEGQQWAELLTWCDRNPNAPEIQWQPAIQFMQNHDLSAFTEFAAHQFVPIQRLRETRFDRTWQAIFQHYSNSLDIILTQEQNQTANLAAWQTFLQQLAEVGIVPPQNFDLAARCAYQNQAYATAIELWNQSPDPQARNHDRYFLAQANCSSVPQSLIWLSKAKQHRTIVALWQKQKQQAQQQDEQPLTSDWLAVETELREALAITNQHRDLLALDVEQHQWLPAIQRLNHRLEAGDASFDDALRLQTLRDLAEDETLSSTTIAQALRQQINPRDTFCRQVLDAYNQESQWIDAVVSVKRRRKLKNPTDQDLNQLYEQRDRLRSELFTLLTQGKSIRIEAANQFVDRCQQVRQAMIEVIQQPYQAKKAEIDREFGDRPHRWEALPNQDVEQEIGRLVGRATQTLSAFVTDTTNLPTWQPSLETLQIASQAFTKIGEFKPAFLFYERFRNHPEEQVRAFAYQQWVDTKQRQAAYAEQNNRTGEAERIRQDIDRTRNWRDRTPILKNEPTISTSQPLKDQIRDRLDTFSEEDLQKLWHYIRFLDYDRQ